LSNEEMRKKAGEIAKELGTTEGVLLDVVERYARHSNRIYKDMQGKKTEDAINVIISELAVIHTSLDYVDKARQIYDMRLATITEALRRMGRL